MAKLVFDEDNVRTIERLSKKYDPETHPALKDFTDTMPGRRLGLRVRLHKAIRKGNHRYLPVCPRLPR